MGASRRRRPLTLLAIAAALLGGVNTSPDLSDSHPTPYMQDTVLDNSSSCQDILRTGDWVVKTCEHDAVASSIYVRPIDQWRELECDNAWTDVIRMWRTCRKSPTTTQDFDFSEEVSNILKVENDGHCHDITGRTRCWPTRCTDNGPNTTAVDRTGPCGHLIWNSFSEIHQMMYNYHDGMNSAGIHLSSNKRSFVKTFAPKAEDDSRVAESILSVNQIPLGIALSRFIGGSFLSKPYFGNKDISATKNADIDSSLSGLMDIGSKILSKTLEAQSNDRAETTFGFLYSSAIDLWKTQSRQVLQALFSGDDETIKVLGAMIKDGKLLYGWQDVATEGYYTSGADQREAIKRAFYGVAIPIAWQASRPAPVLLDFGEGCTVDARKYFAPTDPSRYNIGWRCIDGHSYILAGAKDKGVICTVGNQGQPCAGGPRGILKVLDGMDQIKYPREDWRYPDWGHITIDDIIEGSLNTYKRNGKKNIADPAKAGAVDLKDPSVLDDYLDARVDVRKAGFIRIPVCDPEEARLNIAIGFSAYTQANSGYSNWPCNP